MSGGLSGGRATPKNLTASVDSGSGTGKTHFLEALGQAAVDAGHKVTWFSLEHLGALVRRHGADDTAAKAIRRIMRADVIVIDDIGLLPVTTETAEALYRVVDAAYEKRSIALSSNLHPAGFDELMPKTIANATVDRLLHHAHVVMTAGDSIRLTQATAGKGVGIPPNRGDIVYEEALCHTHDASSTRSSGPVLCGSSGRREGRSLRSPAISGSVRAPLGTGSAKTASSGARPRA